MLKFPTFLFTLMIGHETEPSSAIYVNTNIGAVLCTISMLRKLVRRTSRVRLVYLQCSTVYVLHSFIQDQQDMMTKLRIPLFTADMLHRVVDRDISTPGEGLMTMNRFLWGDDPTSMQLEILNHFDTVDKVKAAFCSCQVHRV